MMRGLGKVFRNVQYILLALGVAFVVFAFAVLLPNTKLLAQVIPDMSIPLGAKLALIGSLFGAIQTNFTLLSASYTIAIAVLFGVNIALFVYYIRAQRGALGGTNSAAGIGGLVSGIFGIGCAACGTFILTWVLGLVGAAGLLSVLPLGGEEFGILGVILLLYAVGITAQKINSPQVCSVD